jgi:hypothetical protein
MKMIFEGKFKTMTKEQIVRFLDMNSMKALKMEKTLGFLQEKAVKD